MNKTLVRLVRKYATINRYNDKEKLKILNMKTVIKYIDQFNWLFDMITGNLYELEPSSQCYNEWKIVKDTYESLKVRARNVVCGKLVDVIILEKCKYDGRYYEVYYGRNKLMVLKEDLSEINL